MRAYSEYVTIQIRKQYRDLAKDKYVEKLQNSIFDLLWVNTVWR